MPGTLTIDAAATFQAVLLMASGPKLKFGSTEQDISARGERKWDVQAAVTYRPTFDGQRLQSEVIGITIAALNDPVDGVPVPSAVVFDQLRAMDPNAPQHDSAKPEPQPVVAAIVTSDLGVLVGRRVRVR